MNLMRINAITAAVVAGSIAAFGAFGGSVQAQDAGDSAFSVDGYVAVSNDYRDRGLSLSDSDFSVFGSLSVFHDSGFYGGIDAALIDDGFGADQKIEYYLGYSFEKGAYIYDLSAELEGFYGAPTGDAYYPEFKGSIARDFGLAFLRGGAAYAPEGRWNTPGVDSFYSYVDLEIPVPTLPSVTFLSHVGYDFRDNRSNLLDWSLGFSAILEPFELSLAYEDSSLDQRIGKGAVVFSAKVYF